MSDSLVSAAMDERVAGEALHESGLTACRKRRFDDALTAFERRVALEPTNAVAWLSLARCQAIAGREGEAKSSCVRSLALDPAQFRGHCLLARLASRAEDGKLRIAALKEAVALRPDAVHLRLILVGLMLRRIQHKAAMAVAKEALVLAPDDPRVMLTVARCHLVLGHLAQAEAMLERSGGAEAFAEERDGLRRDLVARRDRTDAPSSADGTAPGSDGALNRKAKTSVVAAVLPDKDLSTQQSVPIGLTPMAAPMDRAPKWMGAARSGALNVEAFVTADVLRAIERARRGPGFVDHLLIVRALILRDLRLRHRNNSLGVLSELVRPAVVVFVHYWLFYVIHKPMPGQIPIEVYVLAGFSVWFAFNGSWLGAASGGKWPAGATSLPGVTELHLRIAKAAWPLLLNLTFCFLALIPLKFIDRDLPFANVPETSLIFAIAGLSGFGLGLMLDRLGRRFALAKTFEKLLTWGLFVTSGLYFSIETTPPVVAGWFWYNPLLHLVEYERHAFDPGYPVALLDLSYPAVVMVGLLVAGLLVYGSVRCPAHD